MKTRMPHRVEAQRAFTMVELLIVIAIIAILAAILFPVMGTVREQSRQSATMSRLYSVYVGARLYQEDEGRFPEALLGYAETIDTSLNPPYRPALASDAAAAITPLKDIKGTFRTHVGDPTEGVHKGFLYRDQIKEAETFLNSVEPVRDQRATRQVYYPLNSPLGAGSSINSNGILQNGVLVRWQDNVAGSPCAVYGDRDFPAAAYAGEPKLFYGADTVDIGPMLAKDGSAVRDAGGNIVYELHYSPDWSHRLGVSCDGDANGAYVTQLKYKNPPADRTILTYVTHHSAYSRQGTVILLLLTGTAKKIDSKQAFEQLPLNYR